MSGSPRCLFPQQIVSKLRVVRGEGGEVFRVPFPIGREKAKKATQIILEEGPTQMSIAIVQDHEASSNGNFFSCLAFPLIMAMYLFLSSILFSNSMLRVLEELY